MLFYSLMLSRKLTPCSYSVVFILINSYLQIPLSVSPPNFGEINCICLISSLTKHKKHFPLPVLFLASLNPQTPSNKHSITSCYLSFLTADFTSWYKTKELFLNIFPLQLYKHQSTTLSFPFNSILQILTITLPFCHSQHFQVFFIRCQCLLSVP